MADTPATAYGTNMTLLTGNAGGAVQTLLDTMDNGRCRVFHEKLTYNSQAAATVIGVARLPLPFIFLGLMLLADTSSGSTTLAFGSAHNGESAKWAAAAALTATDTPTWRGLTAATGVKQYTGYDSSGSATGYSTGGNNGGGAYTDIVLTLAAATAPASGTLHMFFHYMVD